MIVTFCITALTTLAVFAKTVYAAPSPPDYSNGDPNDEPRIIMGFVTSSRVQEDTMGRKATGDPVEGATVCVYQGTSYFRGDVSNNGSYGTTIKTFEASAITDEYGFFHVDTRWVKDGDSRSYFDVDTPPSNFVAFYCGRKLKELYRVDIRQTLMCDDGKGGEQALSPVARYVKHYGQATGGNINKDITLFAPDPLTIDCAEGTEPGDFGDYAAPGHPECPKEISYMDRAVESRLSCEPVGDQQAGMAYHPNLVWPTSDVHFEDPQFRGYLPEDVPPENIAKEGLIEGREDTKAGMADMHRYMEGTNNIIGGLLTGHVEPAHNPAERKAQELFDCNLFKEANQGVNFENPDMNMQVSWNFGITLMAPASNNGPNTNPNSMAAKYMATDPDKNICYYEGTLLTLKEIQPPREWLPPGEPYCNPGDPGCIYVLDKSYFPYDRIFREGTASDITFFNDVKEDSYGDYKGRRNVFYDPADPDPYNDTRGGLTESNYYKPGGRTSHIDYVNVSSDYALDTEPPIRVIFPPASTTSASVPRGKELVEYDKELKEFAYCTQDQNAWGRIGRSENLCTFSVLDGHKLNPLQRTIDREGLTEGMYDIAVTGETEDTDHYYGKDQSGRLLSTFAATVQWIVNMFNWESHKGGVCVPGQPQPVPWCDASNDPDCREDCYDDGTGVIVCNYTKTFYDNYNCDGEAVFELQAETATYFRNKNVYEPDAATFLLMAPNEYRADISAECGEDAYATNAAHKVTEGYYTNCGKDPVASGDRMRALASTLIDKKRDLLDTMEDDPPIPGVGEGGSGTTGPGEQSLAVCDGAPEPTGHNVKPLEILKAQFGSNVDKAHIDRCYNYIINRAKATGNDPALIMALWIEESGASNYSLYPGTKDFGCGSRGADFAVGLGCMLGYQQAVTRPGDFRAKCMEIKGPTNKMDVEEFLQPYACGPGSASQGNICYATPPTFYFDCTATNQGGGHWPDRINSYYSKVHRNGKGLDFDQQLPASDWSN